MDVRITTEEKRALVKDQDTAKGVLSEIEDLEVDDASTFELAANLLIEVKRQSKDLETRQKRVTDPLNTALKEVRSWFKPANEYLEAAEQTLRAKVGGFIVGLREGNEEAMLKVSEAHDFYSANEAAAAIQKLPKVKGVSVGVGWDFEVTDEESVPRAYLTVDEKALKEYVEAHPGVPPPALPGVRFFRIPKVIVRVG
jgi:hypothetical protein